MLTKVHLEAAITVIASRILIKPYIKAKRLSGIIKVIQKV